MSSLPAPLIKDISEGRCLPFVGAGFSKNSILPNGLRMPDWIELAETLANGAGIQSTLTPPAVAERYEKRFGRVELIEAIRRALHGEKAKPGEAHLAFAMLPFETVYTTNFDLLLEDSYSLNGRPFRSLVGELQMPFHAGQMASNIVKMHGDLRHEEHVVVTQKDYDEFMTRYPVIATHLSAMLITRTPLFIGYSLTDPDFLHIRSVVRSRLGDFERMAYAIQFDFTSDEVERALDQKINIVSLQVDRGKSRDLALGELFRSVLSELDAETGSRFRASRPDAFEHVERNMVTEAVASIDFAPILTATSKLCFVLMPFGDKFDVVYRKLIVPSVTEVGLTAVRADELAAPGSIMEQIRVAIQQARLCVVVLTGNNPNVMFELGLAQAAGKATVLLCEDITQVPFDLRAHRVITYKGDGLQALDSLRSAIRAVLTGDKLRKAEGLFGNDHFRGAILEAAIVLDGGLRRVALKHADDSEYGRARLRSAAHMSLGQLLNHLSLKHVLDSDFLQLLRDAVAIRNHAVHDQREPTHEEAAAVIKAAKEFAVRFPEEFESETT